MWTCDYNVMVKYGSSGRIGKEGLNVNYYTRIDYGRAAGEAIFINSNLILTDPAVSAGGGRPRETMPSAEASYLRDHTSQKKGQVET